MDRSKNLSWIIPFKKLAGEGLNGKFWGLILFYVLISCRFWLACQELKSVKVAVLHDKVHEIYS